MFISVISGLFQRIFYLTINVSNKTTFIFHTCLLILLITAACGGKKHYDDKLLAKVYVENLIAREKYLGSKDSLDLVLNNIFKESGISQQEYENELKSFADEYDRWKQFFREAESYLTERQESMSSHNK